MYSLTYQFIFDEVTHDLVVEILNGRPLDALLNILFLRLGTKMKMKFVILTVVFKRSQAEVQPTLISIKQDPTYLT